MPLCHQCEWYERPPDEAKRRACLACPGPSEELTHKGRVHVSIDAGGAQTAAGVEASLARMRDEGGVAIDDSDPEIKAAMEAGGLRVLLYIKDLSKEQLVLLWYVLREGSLADVGRATGRTRAMVSHLWRGLVQARPELAAVVDGSKPAQPLPEKKPRAAAQKPVQDDFFDFFEGKTGGD